MEPLGNENDKINVLICSTGMVSIPPIKGGAIESYINDLCTMFGNDSKVDVTVVSNVRYDSYMNEFSNIHFVPSKSPVDDFPLTLVQGAFAHVMGGFLTSFVSRKQLTNLSKNDEVVVHINEEVNLSFLSVFLKNTPTVFTLHNPPPLLSSNHLPFFQKNFRKISSKLTILPLIKLHGEVISINPAMNKWFIDNGIEKERIHHIPLPVDTTKFTDSKNGEHAASDYMLFVGRLDSRKDPIGLVRELKDLITNNIKLVIVGDGPLREPLQKYIVGHHLEKRISLYSRITERQLIDMYQGARFLIFPSHLEAYPRAVIEAASCGLPIVMQNLSIYDEFTKNDFTQTYDNSNNDGLKNAVLSFVDDENLLRRKSANARKYVLNNASYEVVRLRTEEVYRKAINER